MLIAAGGGGAGAAAGAYTEVTVDQAGCDAPDPAEWNSTSLEPLPGGTDPCPRAGLGSRHTRDPLRASPGQAHFYYTLRPHERRNADAWPTFRGACADKSCEPVGASLSTGRDGGGGGGGLPGAVGGTSGSDFGGGGGRSGWNAAVFSDVEFVREPRRADDDPARVSLFCRSSATAAPDGALRPQFTRGAGERDPASIDDQTEPAAEPTYDAATSTYVFDRPGYYTQFKLPDDCLPTRVRMRGADAGDQRYFGDRRGSAGEEVVIEASNKFERSELRRFLRRVHAIMIGHASAPNRTYVHAVQGGFESGLLGVPEDNSDHRGCERDQLYLIASARGGQPHSLAASVGGISNVRRDDCRGIMFDAPPFPIEDEPLARDADVIVGIGNTLRSCITGEPGVYPFARLEPRTRYREGPVRHGRVEITCAPMPSEDDELGNACKGRVFFPLCSRYQTESLCISARDNSGLPCEPVMAPGPTRTYCTGTKTGSCRCGGRSRSGCSVACNGRCGFVSSPQGGYCTGPSSFNVCEAQRTKSQCDNIGSPCLWDTPPPPDVFVCNATEFMPTSCAALLSREACESASDSCPQCEWYFVNPPAPTPRPPTPQPTPSPTPAPTTINANEESSLALSGSSVGAVDASGTMNEGSATNAASQDEGTNENSDIAVDTNDNGAPATENSAIDGVPEGIALEPSVDSSHHSFLNMFAATIVTILNFV